MQTCGEPTRSATPSTRPPPRPPCFERWHASTVVTSTMPTSSRPSTRSSGSKAACAAAQARLTTRFVESQAQHRDASPGGRAGVLRRRRLRRLGGGTRPGAHPRARAGAVRDAGPSTWSVAVRSPDDAVAHRGVGAGRTRATGVTVPGRSTGERVGRPREAPAPHAGGAGRRRPQRASRQDRRALHEPPRPRAQGTKGRQPRSSGRTSTCPTPLRRAGSAPGVTASSSVASAPCADRVDAAAAVERCRIAEGERRVTIRPVPDAMALVTALLPVTQAVAVHAALTRAALSGKAAGDERGKGQLMADALVELVTGQSVADDVPVEVQVVITDRAMLAGDETPAHVPGYGPVPAGWVRELLTRHSETETDDRAHPATTALRAGQSRPGQSRPGRPTPRRASRLTAAAPTARNHAIPRTSTPPRSGCVDSSPTRPAGPSWRWTAPGDCSRQPSAVSSSRVTARAARPGATRPSRTPTTSSRTPTAVRRARQRPGPLCALQPRQGGAGLVLGGAARRTRSHRRSPAHPAHHDADRAPLRLDCSPAAPDAATCRYTATADRRAPDGQAEVIRLELYRRADLAVELTG